MVEAGVPNVMISNEVVGAAKLERLAQLSKSARISICVDDEENVSNIDAALRRAGSILDVLIEVEVGALRCGVAPGQPVLALANRIAACDHLRFAGLHAYQGAAQHVRSATERRARIDRAAQQVRSTLELLHDYGFNCEIVTGAGTGTYPLEAVSGIYNEIQPGSYVFMDADYQRNLDEDGNPIRYFEQSLFIWTTIMSHPTEDRAVVDAGLKAASVDSGMPVVAGPGAEYLRASDEHGVLQISDHSRFRLGDKIRLIPGHCDPTVNLYDWIVGYRGEDVEVIWPIAARGAFY